MGHPSRPHAGSDFVGNVPDLQSLAQNAQTQASGDGHQQEANECGSSRRANHHGFFRRFGSVVMRCSRIHRSRDAPPHNIGPVVIGDKFGNVNRAQLAERAKCNMNFHGDPTRFLRETSVHVPTKFEGASLVIGRATGNISSGKIGKDENGKAHLKGILFPYPNTPTRPLPAPSRHLSEGKPLAKLQRERPLKADDVNTSNSLLSVPRVRYRQSLRVLTSTKPRSEVGSSATRTSSSSIEVAKQAQTGRGSPSYNHRQSHYLAAELGRRPSSGSSPPS
ncbi:hypothetical protein BKA70DRAFT_1234080 [Coprinopsis sp. MPI-PUGE-AT-0042]|nr:hypothetical protein BKA70DRAFT_1234080 [Coprinopsis sp. MPI-PUGE-AT-0042]